jgi:hypothetical protein
VGLTLPTTRAQTAYFASWASFGPSVAARWPYLADGIAAIGDATVQTAATLPPYGADLVRQRAHAIALHDTSTTEPAKAMATALFASHPLSNVQRALGEAQAERTAADILKLVHADAVANPTTRAATLAQWKGVTGDGRTSFLHAHPASVRTVLDGPALGYASRRLLRLPLPGLENAPKCGYCGAALDAFGDHVDTCPGLIHQREIRHHYVNDHAVLAPARQARLPATKEPPRLVDGTNGRPADTGIAWGHGFGHGITACYDVVGCGTAVGAYVAAATARVGGAMEKAVARKLNNARKLDPTLVVVPLAFDSQGVLHTNWKATYEEWAARWASVGPGREGGDGANLVRRWMCVASTSIQRSQHRMTATLVEASARVGPHGVEPREWRPPTAPELLAQRCTAPPGG